MTLFETTPISLSPRMKAVLMLLSEGYTYKGVSVILSIKRGTVRKHIYRAMKVLNAKTVTQAVVIFTKEQENLPH